MEAANTKRNALKVLICSIVPLLNTKNLMCNPYLIKISKN